MLHSFLGDGSAFAVIGKFFWVAQLALIVHVIRTGRPYWWIWLLFMAPFIGGAAYVLIELLPDMRGAGATISWKPRALRIRELRTELEDTDTVKLRLALAEELLGAGDTAEARTAAEECLRGVFRDDPHTLAAVARYRLEDGDAAGALDTLGRVKIEADRRLATQVTALRGRALVTVGRHAEAQQALRSVQGSFIGDEPQYYLGLSLQQTGAVAEAREIWNEIRKRYRRAGPAWRRTEKRWFKLAGERLDETKD